MPETENLYEILQLHPSAHPDVIQAAYRRLAMLYHPDKNPATEAADQMAALNRAYAILSDPAKRAEYDHNRATPAGSAAGQPQDASQNPAGYITLGSTKSEVEAIHGPPQTVSAVPQNQAEIWHYQNDDSVEFGLDTGRVQGWNNKQNNLPTRLTPGPNVTDYDYLVGGDHRDEVARLQGTPGLIEVRRYADREKWEYSDKDSVEFIFSTGRVIGWSNGGDTLKLGPGNWKIQNLSIYTVDPVNSNRRLIVGLINNKLEVYVAWGKGNKISQSKQTTVEHRIDNGPIWWHPWLVSADKTAIFVPAQARIDTIQALMYAREFTVSVYPFSGNPKDTASFQITGFSKAVNFVIEAQRRADLSSPARHYIQSRGGCILVPAAAIGAAAIAAPAIWLFL